MGIAGRLIALFAPMPKPGAGITSAIRDKPATTSVSSQPAIASQCSHFHNNIVTSSASQRHDVAARTNSFCSA
jgi:hypothetical protein